MLPGVRYGRPDELLTPAYWVMRNEIADISETNFADWHGSLREEVGFCLLGGFGVAYEIAEAFFNVLKSERMFDEYTNPSEAKFFNLLNEPVEIQGRSCRYRFPRQRAYRLCGAMKKLSFLELKTDDPISFRNEIQTLVGVGPKTASWIARNWLGTDAVAILDIHVLRAGWAMGLFSRECKLPRDYALLEDRFIAFAQTINVRASILDAIIWSDMRKFGSRLMRDANLMT